MQPAPKEALHRSRTEPVADLLQGGWIFRTAEPVVEAFIPDADFLYLSLA
jgi:hypothetical protein